MTYRGAVATAGRGSDGGRRRAAAACLLLAAAMPAFAALPESVERLVSAHRLPESSLGIIVQEVGAEDPIVSLNPDTPRNPASAIKVVTTLAALEELGPAWTWNTEVYADGAVRNGTLEGDLIFKGYGDPYLVTEEFWKLLQALRRNGITDVNGDMVVDGSYFIPPAEDPGAFDNRPFHAYNALPNALLVNFKSVYFHFYAAPGGSSVTIHTEPELANLEIDNRLTTTGGRCGGYQRGIAVIVPDAAAADRVVFEGRFPRACRYYILSRSVLTPETYAFGVFKSLWQQLGGTISGDVRAGLAPENGRPVLTWRSRPLGEIIRLVNKYSNNVMTRQILLTLGAELKEEPGTVEKGVQAVHEYLTERDIDPASLNLVNGAGLSRDVRVSPRMLADLLEYADSIPFMPEFVSSLSIIGMDGTARNRLKHNREAGHAHIKTGTIDHVSAVAGYVDAASGKRFVIVGLLNHKDAHRGPGEQFWNALVRWTFKQ